MLGGWKQQASTMSGLSLWDVILLVCVATVLQARAALPSPQVLTRPFLYPCSSTAQHPWHWWGRGVVTGAVPCLLPSCERVAGLAGAQPPLCEVSLESFVSTPASTAVGGEMGCEG